MVFISSIVENRPRFYGSFQLWEQEKSQGAKSGEYGG